MTSVGIGGGWITHTLTHAEAQPVVGKPQPPAQRKNRDATRRKKRPRRKTKRS